MLRAPLILLVLAGIVLSCEGGDQPTTSAPSSQATTTAAPTAAARQPASSASTKQAAASAATSTQAPQTKDAKEEQGLQLLEPGSEPRAALRYQPKPGAKEIVTYTQKVSQAEVGSKQRGAPSTRMTLELTFQDQNPAGDLRYELAVAAAEVEPEPGMPPAMVDAVKSAVQSIKGMTGRLVVSDRGTVREAKMTVPDTMAAQHKPLAEQLGENMRQVIIPLPTAPVGVGARWEQVLEAKQAGAVVEQLARYELLSKDGNTVKLKTTVEQKAKAQTLQPAPGVSMKLESYAGTGQGTAALDLGRLLATASKTELKGAMAISAPGRPRKEVRMTMAFTLKSQ